MVLAISPPVVENSIPFERILRFTAKEYNRLTEIGFFTTEHRVELLNGWLVTKMPQKSLHATALDLLEEQLGELLPVPWTFRTQRPVALTGDSVPEPDLVVVKGPKRRFFKGHPTPKDIAVIVEVSDTTLEQDRGLKRSIYAQDRLPAYWIVNLVDNCVEVYTLPRGGKLPSYRQMRVYGANDAVPVILEGETIGEVPVAELLQ